MLAAVAMAAPALAQAPGEQPMSPEQKAQMEAWMKAMTPGKAHQDLAGKTGTWEGTSTMWDAPTTPPQVSQVRAERKMGLGGRVLLDSWSGVMMGMPFEGMGTTGFNNVDGKWWGTWADNFSTGLMTTTRQLRRRPEERLHLCRHLRRSDDAARPGRTGRPSPGPPPTTSGWRCGRRAPTARSGR